jgi:DNA ligase D-like protein (predicted 3'-phosphoesterase)
MAARKKTTKSASRRDPLKEYRQKRDFSRTSEPQPAPAKADGHGFVVQKHAARRLHYDLRLEHAGTLKSWAVTRGPSLIAGEKRLAVQTEDHPLQYLDFEGNIPKGEYGGGSMIVWDRGTWDSAYDPDHGFKKGHLDITLHGSRLKGRWHLVRMRKRPGERNEQWLLIKSDDEFARHSGEPDITDEETTSALSGLTTEELAAKGDLRKDHAGRTQGARARKQPPPDPKKIKGARKGILPAFLEPSLPQTTDKAPSGPNWVHEIKYDGYRTQARIDGHEVKLLTRKGLDWTARFKTELLTAAAGPERRQERPLPLFRLRPALLRRLRSHPGDARRPQGPVTADRRRAVVRFADSLQRPSRAGRADGVRARRPHRPGRHRLQAPRPALSARPRRPLAQDQEHVAAGVRHPGLCPLDRRERHGRRALARLLRRRRPALRRPRRLRVFQRPGARAQQAARKDRG